MANIKNIKLYLAITYFIILFVFLWFLFKNFNLDDFRSFELIKSNRDLLEEVKNKNILISSILFFIFTIIWTLLLGFATPVVLMAGFIFGKVVGSLIVIFGFSVGATLLYLFVNFFLKDLIYEKFSSKYSYLIDKFKKNEFIYFIIYRAVGGIPFFIQNLLPIIFNIKIKNYFFGSMVGMAPQLFIGVSLGSGINKIIDENLNMPSFFDMIIEPEIYLPIIGLIIIFLVALIFRKQFFRQ